MPVNKDGKEFIKFKQEFQSHNTIFAIVLLTNCNVHNNMDRIVLVTKCNRPVWVDLFL